MIRHLFQLTDLRFLKNFLYLFVVGILFYICIMILLWMVGVFINYSLETNKFLEFTEDKRNLTGKLPEMREYYYSIA